MDEPDLSDEALMLRLKGGEDLALNMLMDRWETPLTSFIIRYTGNRDDALDLAQETFVRIYRSCGRYRAKAKFSTWMFTIAANRCRNHARWRSRHPTVSLSEGGGDGEPGDWTDRLEDGCESPDAGAEKAEDARRVRAAVHALPNDLRTAVLLFEFEDMTQSEIGKVLGCSAKAVETRLYRARQILRARLGDLGAPG